MARLDDDDRHAAMTPGEAHLLLRQADDSTITRHRDRRAHAAYLTGVGVLLGLWAGIAWATADAAWAGLVTLGLQIAYIAALVTLVARRERRARTVPRGVRRASLWGTVGTGALFLAATFPLLDRGAGGVPAGVAITAVVAAPAVVAAALVRRGPRP